ncbi:WD40-repeat-containing domain protein [Globomyces pollinis-pini]|nr:WD40-repeat-containing domain protein [Globomyces pollinis-pini]
MGEFLNILLDLSCMAEHLPAGILVHGFSRYKPSESKSLKESINHFHMRELEASDYRSAYHQFSDWLYGWSVSDGTDENVKRIPRDIELKHDRERADAERLMKTFETLTSISLRHLKVCFSVIEVEMPKLGTGLDTLSTNNGDDSSQHDLTLNQGHILEKVWATKLENNADLPILDPEILDSIEKEEKENLEKEKQSDFNESDFPQPRSRQGSIVPDLQAGADGVTPSRQGSIVTQLSGLASHHGSFQFLKSPEAKLSQINELVDEPEAISKEDSLGMDGMAKEASHLIEAVSNTDLAFRALQRDVDHVFKEVDQCTEYILVAMCSVSAILGFAELLDDQEMFRKATQWAHEISQGFVSNTLKTVWDLFNREIPHETTLATLRNPTELKGLLLKLIKLREVDGMVPKLKYRKLYHKFATLHDIFTLMDIHIFPNFVFVHKEGVKCAKFSAFDSCLWLTGGYDCHIRITDIRESNKHMTLAQYIGHKSIITDVQFTKNDSHIVSSSYDRTLKIWNAQTAVCERTLSGHLDAVTSCDVSVDGRFIASSSLDNCVRFWDFSTGECITVIKKHTRWVKIVRFSHDGRYLATAGMDRKVYIWDTKILINSRSPSHSRCIDNFNDYVLDMVLFKPTLLLTTSRDSMLKLFDFSTGHEMFTFNLAPSWACTLSLSANGEYVVTGSFDNNINIFKTKDLTKVREIRAFNLGILCVRFPVDLSYILVGTTEGFIQEIPL